MEKMDLGIHITQAALLRMKALMEKAPEGVSALRLSVKPSGCSGNSYKMDYVEAGDTGVADDILERDGVRVHIPQISSWMLMGMTIDYTSDALGNAHFVFTNPNETGRCGCGESFKV